MTEEHHRKICQSCLAKEYEAYRHGCVHESMERNKTWLERFRIDQWPRWDYDHEGSRLIFSEAGRSRVSADIVVVGTVDKKGSRWEWAWGNPNIPAVSREKMDKARTFGAEKGWSQLTSLFLDNDEYLGWELTSISHHLLNAEGVYRCPDDEEPGHFIYVLAFDTHFIN